MGYYMRFITADEQDVSLSILETALKGTDLEYQIERDEETDSEGAITYRGDVYGQIEINRPGDGIFDDEIAWLQSLVEKAEGAARLKVLGILNQAKAIIAVRVLDQGRQSEETLARLDPLWHWLLTHRAGLLQAEGEGYYDAAGLILHVA